MYSARVLEDGNIRIDCNPDTVYHMVPQDSSYATNHARGALESVPKITHGDIFYFLWIFAPHLFPETVRNQSIEALQREFHAGEIINHNYHESDETLPSQYSVTIGNDFVCEGARHLITEPVREYLKQNLDKLVCFLNAIKIIPMFESNQTSKVTSSAMVCTSDVQSRDFLSVLTRSGIKLNLTDGSNSIANILIDTSTIHKENLPQYEKSLYDTYQTFMRSFRQSYEHERYADVMKLKTQLANSKKKYLITGLKLADIINTGGWKIVVSDGVTYFEYPKKIVVEKIIGPLGNVHKIPKDILGLLYLGKLRVPVEMTITKAYGTGMHPHRRGSLSDTDMSTSKQWSEVCIGDMMGQPIDNLNGMIDMFKAAHFMSMYGGITSAVVHILMEEGREVPISSDWHKKWIGKFKAHEGIFAKAKKKGGAVFSAGM